MKGPVGGGKSANASKKPPIQKPPIRKGKSEARKQQYLRSLFLVAAIPFALTGLIAISQYNTITPKWLRAWFDKNFNKGNNPWKKSPPGATAGAGNSTASSSTAKDAASAKETTGPKWKLAKREVPLSKKMNKADVRNFRQYWMPQEEDFWEYLLQHPRTIEQGVLTFVVDSACSFCKVLLRHLNEKQPHQIGTTVPSSTEYTKPERKIQRTLLNDQVPVVLLDEAAMSPDFGDKYGIPHISPTAVYWTVEEVEEEVLVEEDEDELLVDAMKNNTQAENGTSTTTLEGQTHSVVEKVKEGKNKNDSTSSSAVIFGDAEDAASNASATASAASNASAATASEEDKTTTTATSSETSEQHQGKKMKKKIIKKLVPVPIVYDSRSRPPLYRQPVNRVIDFINSISDDRDERLIWAARAEKEFGGMIGLPSPSSPSKKAKGDSPLKEEEQVVDEEEVDTNEGGVRVTGFQWDDEQQENATAQTFEQDTSSITTTSNSTEQEELPAWRMPVVYAGEDKDEILGEARLTNDGASRLQFFLSPEMADLVEDITLERFYAYQRVNQARPQPQDSDDIDDFASDILEWTALGQTSVQNQRVLGFRDADALRIDSRRYMMRDYSVDTLREELNCSARQQIPPMMGEKTLKDTATETVVAQQELPTMTAETAQEPEAAPPASGDAQIPENQQPTEEQQENQAQQVNQEQQQLSQEQLQLSQDQEQLQLNPELLDQELSSDEDMPHEDSLPWNHYDPCQPYLINRRHVHTDYPLEREPEERERRISMNYHGGSFEYPAPDEDLSLSFGTKNQAYDFLMSRMGLALAPSFSRLHVESLPHHIGKSIAVLITNWPVYDKRVLMALRQAQQKMQFLMHSVYLDIREEPKMQRERIVDTLGLWYDEPADFYSDAQITELGIPNSRYATFTTAPDDLTAEWNQEDQKMLEEVEKEASKYGSEETQELEKAMSELDQVMNGVEVAGVDEKLNAIDHSQEKNAEDVETANSTNATRTISVGELLNTTAGAGDDGATAEEGKNSTDNADGTNVSSSPVHGPQEKPQKMTPMRLILYMSSRIGNGPPYPEYFGDLTNSHAILDWVARSLTEPLQNQMKEKKNKPSKKAANVGKQCSVQDPDFGQGFQNQGTTAAPAGRKKCAAKGL
ncbi:unnamed protein product [Amoebophrya sp. A25]|nr:unnamed protein product [Amoebophrya sp. A25]|eukprot:GSA25T00016935001.1